MRKVTLRVVFADDNYLVRAGVSALLSEDDEIDLVTVVADADALIRAVAEHRPDAVLTDIRMPPTHTIEGIDAAKRIRAAEVGFFRYLTKPVKVDELTRALEQLLEPPPPPES